MSPRLILCSASAVVLMLGASGCKDRQAAEAQPEPSPPQVHVAAIRTRAVPVVHDLPGRVAPMRIAEVRARVAGLVVKRAFKQGSEVREGDLLYKLDPEPFQVELQSAEAVLARNEAALALARQQADRLKSLLKSQTSSQAQYDAAYAALRQAEADVASAKASRARAQLHLSYTDVRAPIGGRIGAALITEGALVEQGAKRTLAKVQQLDPIYVDITQSVSQLNGLRRDLASGELASIAHGSANARLIMEDGTLYAHAGRLLFSGVTADPSTGQVTLRAEFPNPDGDLFPGMYVRARVQQGIDKDAIVVPREALQRSDEGQSSVYVVDDEYKVTQRSVEAGPLTKDGWVVENGIEPGERVVTDGFDGLTTGTLVKVVAGHALAEAGVGTDADDVFETVGDPEYSSREN